MAFLDNSGDIILDAVLTDTGRARLAKGDGSFRIVKFALADDEIDYSQYQNANYPGGANPSGSAYYDLEILMTPILEAFTNNSSSMKSKVLSIPRNNLLYLPVIKLNDQKPATGTFNNIFWCGVDEDTEEDLTAVLSAAQGSQNNSPNGLLYGESPGSNGVMVRTDQGLDTTEISSNFTIDNDLLETQYIIEIDNRFGAIVDMNGNSASVSFIDDDNIASYYLSLGTDTNYVYENTVIEGESGNATEVIAGPRGTYLQLKVRSSLEVNTSDFLFTKLGSTAAYSDLAVISAPLNGTNYYFIDSNIRVSGATTGYRIDIPVRFVKTIN